MKAFITGGTGLLGRALLEQWPDAIIASRNPERVSAPAAGRVVRCDPTQPIPEGLLDGCDVVFNLAGEPVGDGRWTDARKARIRESRVACTRNVVGAIRAMTARPKVLISASASGYYGDRGDVALVEREPVGHDFLAEVCGQWEAEAKGAEELGVRVVCLRIGIVLAPGGGALARLLPPFKLGLGGRLGSGDQWMPWIHIDDVVGLLLHAATNLSVRGPMNAAAPGAATNREFTRELGRVLSRPTWLTVPRIALRAAFGEFSGALLSSQRVVPEVALESGYAFRYPELGPALAELLRASKAR